MPNLNNLPKTPKTTSRNIYIKISNSLTTSDRICFKIQNGSSTNKILETDGIIALFSELITEPDLIGFL